MSLHFVNVFTEFKSYQISNKYIRSTLAASQDITLDFVVVDNSLDDSNFEKLTGFYTDQHTTLEFEGKVVKKADLTFENRHTTVYYIKNDRNSGYGSGGNLAMRVAMRFLNPDYLVVSNNDMVCLDDHIAFDKIHAVFQNHTDVGIVGVNVKNLDDSKQTPYRYVNFTDRWILPELFYPISRKFKKHSATDLINNPPTDYVYRVRGSFMAVLPEAFEKTGGFDENVFLYGEEPILAERMNRCGYKVYHLNDIHMLHDHIMDNRTLTNNEKKKLEQRFKSEMYYYQNYKNVSPFLIQLATWLSKQYFIRVVAYRKYKEWRHRK